MSRKDWVQLTREQPRTLAAIVQYSKSNAGFVPKPKELAGILGIEKRAVSERIARLMPYFVKKKRRLKVDGSHLCTRKISALFLLIVKEMSPRDADGRVFKSELLEELKSKYGADFSDPELVNKLWDDGINNGYLTLVTPDCVVPGTFTTYQFEYLEIIAGRVTK